MLDKMIPHQKAFSCASAPAALFTLIATPQVLLKCQRLCHFLEDDKDSL